MLTAEQERFSQLIFQDFSQYEAYVQAYNPHATRNSIHVSASRLANNPKIVLRIQELRNAAVAPVIADIVERKLHASNVMRDQSASHREATCQRAYR